jgi:CheY-like chemotaxis protein
MADFTRLTVLLVENNPYVRALIREMLVAFGAGRIAEAGTVVDAVQIVDNVPLDLVILDFFLDRMDGADFTRMVRQNESVSNRQVPILLLTALPNQAKIAKMRDCGVNVIVTKPVAPRTLFNHIREIMDRPREFIVCDSYVGPCRRRRQMDVPPALDRRRRRHEPSPVEHDRMVGSPAG